MMLAPIAARAAYLDAELRRLATNAATLNAEDLRFELRRAADLADPWWRAWRAGADGAQPAIRAAKRSNR